MESFQRVIFVYKLLLYYMSLLCHVWTYLGLGYTIHPNSISEILQYAHIPGSTILADLSPILIANALGNDNIRLHRTAAQHWPRCMGRGCKQFWAKIRQNIAARDI